MRLCLDTAAACIQPDTSDKTNRPRLMLTEPSRLENLDRHSIIYLTSWDIFKREYFCFHNSKPHNPFVSPVRAWLTDSLDQTEKATCPWLQTHTIRIPKKGALDKMPHPFVRIQISYSSAAKNYIIFFLVPNKYCL